MQGIASDMFCEWYNTPIQKRLRSWFEISGAAGTGKTTVVKHIINRLGLEDNEVVFIAFVGKAALAMRLSGVNGRTIHSVIYKRVHRYKRENGKIVYKNGVPIIETVTEKVNKLSSDIKLIVLDEGGMVDSNIGNDILSFHIPLLVLGDLHQLPPVFGKSLFLHKPDVVLNEIMRQHKDSSIIYLSQLAMHGFTISYGSYNNGESVVMKKQDLTDDHLRWADLIICGTNHMRDIINWYMRKNICGIDSNTIVPGDKLICRQNCWDIILDDPTFGIDIALVNGMIGTVEDTNRENSSASTPMSIDFKPEFSDISFKNIPIRPRYIMTDYAHRKTENPMFSPGVSFEFGYCSTCHLAQGSQYPNILIYLDLTYNASEYFNKWLYTAITRAQSKLIIAI